MSFCRVGVLALSLELLLVEGLRRHARSDWVEKPGLNCFPGNGADLPPNTAEPAADGQSLAGCKALCSNTPQCTAIAMRGSDGECYLRMNVVESRCVANDPYGYDTYLKTSPPAPTPAPAPTPPPAPTPYPLNEEIFIRSHSNQNLLSRAQWVLRDAGGGKVYIESQGQNLQDNNGQVGLSGNAQEWEQWTISSAGEGKVIFTSHRGEYLQDDNGQFKMSGTLGAWEAWTFKVPVSLPNIPRYDTAWKELITGSTCPPSTPLTPSMPASGQPAGQITCELSSGGVRRFRFPVGLFDIDEQVEVPANTHIEGNKSPIDPADKSREPDPADQTYFVATSGVSDVMAPYCGTNNNLQPGDAQKLRIGFLLNSNTVVKNINYQGRDTIRPYDNGSLCGGAVFETPGCVSPGYSNGGGWNWFNPGSRMGCHDGAGRRNDLITGDGKGVENILIDSVRLNGLFLEDYEGISGMMAAPSSQIAVWVAMTNDGSATKNVRINNLVAMHLRGDGINFHGNVQDSIAEDCHIENTGDDIYAAWGGYAENMSGIVFRNNVGKNPGVARNYGYGVCVAIYGARDVTVTGTKCYDLADWNPGQDPRGNGACLNGPHCNSCVSFIKDRWFGAVYPEGHTINIYDNEYLTMAGAPITDRPMVRDQRR